MYAKRTMKAIVTTGVGDYDKLEYRDVPVPVPGANEVLLKVLAAGVNNTEINTRVGWYSANVTGATNETAVNNAEESAHGERADGGWNDATPFPLIQGTDCCGLVEAAGPGVENAPIGRRVLVRACMRTHGFASLENVWMGSDFDGAFAQYVTVPAAEIFPVECGWSDEELATVPCAYGTAENMLHRAGVAPGETVLVAGASGGVGSAAVQLARRRGATVIAVTGTAKAGRLRVIGANIVIVRGSDLIVALGENSVDVVVDNVGGDVFPKMLQLLRRGGRYVSSGAVAGPIVALDLRTMYLKDQTLIGCTAWDEPVFPNLIGYIERGEIKPLLEKTFPLERIADAQRELIKREHVGKFVLAP